MAEDNQTPAAMPPLLRRDRPSLWRRRKLASLTVLLAGAACGGVALANTYSIERIGLTGEEYTRPADHFALGHAQAINGSGQVLGSSARYVGAAYDSGLAAWIHSQGSTQRIGLLGEGYTDTSSGYALSMGQFMNEAGQVVGISSRYAGSSFLGQVAWLYGQGVTQAIGLRGSGYTDPSTGYASSTVQALNQNGQAIGMSMRYDASGPKGQAAWIHSQGQAQQIGLTGVGFIQTASGESTSQALALNNAGQVLGVSARYQGAYYAGQAAWLHSQGATQQIGLAGHDYVNATDGSAFSTVRSLNQAGQAIGTSQRYAHGIGTGQDAWIHSGGSTQRIGLTGADYVQTATQQSSSVAQAINDAGQVIGHSSRYNDWSNTGQAAWLYSQGVTQRIGLTGGVHESALDGRAFSSALALNEAGQVIGHSSRYLNGVDAGQTAWFFDDTLATSFALEFSVRSDGYAHSEALFLGEDGLVLGSFEAYAGDASLGRKAFAWTLAGGFIDLGVSVVGGLDPNWLTLASAVRANGLGQIVGMGTLTSGGQGAFLLTPVPEPEHWLMLLGGLGLLRALTRRHRLVPV